MSDPEHIGVTLPGRTAGAHAGADEPERRLAVGVIRRAALDMAGGRVNNPELLDERGAAAAARTWVEEASEDFRFWAAVAGIDWRRARKRLLGIIAEKANA